MGDRPGGYTRIIKTGFRPSDGADMCFIELVDYDENMAKTPKKTTRRSRRSGAKKAAQETVVEETAPVQEEAPVAEEETPVAEEAPAVEDTAPAKEEETAE